jgi:hypothetical protein
MTQFAVGANGASAKIYGGTAAYALANGTLYRLILGDPWRWTVVPAPFTPVSIRASENSAVALDSSRRLWTLTSLYTVSEWYDPITHWHTVLGSTWENNAQLPDGITDIATGGPSDIFAFGATQNVQRLFPTSTVDIGESVAENYVGNLPNNLPNGMDFRQTGHTTLTEKCGRLGTLTLIDSFFDRYFLLAYTRVKYTNNMYNCATGNNGITLCDYSTTSWCTPETTEPTFNPTAVTDRYPPLPLGYWEAGSLCLKVLSTDPWWCSNLTSYALQTTGPGGIMPRAVCTKK